MAYLIRRRDGSEKLKYYQHFDGRHGIPARTKKDAPRFDDEMATRICNQLEKLDNREWEKFEDKPKAKKEPKPKKAKAVEQQPASA